MDKQGKLVFLESEFIQSTFILQDNEIRNKVASFLFDYVSIEAFYKTLLIAMKESSGKQLSQSEKKRLSVQAAEVKRVLDYFGIHYDEALIERLFGSNDNNYMQCSVKKLRDRLVHRVNDNVLRIIIERYDSISQDMKSFLALFNIQA